MPATHYFRVGLFRAIISHVRRGMGRELYIVDRKALVSWAETLTSIRGFHFDLSAQPSMWTRSGKWLDQAIEAINCAQQIRESAEGCSADRDLQFNNVRQAFGLAAECVLNAHNLLLDWQASFDWAPAGGRDAGIAELLTIEYDELLAKCPPSTGVVDLTEDALVARCDNDLAALRYALGARDDLQWCLDSRKTVTNWFLLRAVYPHRWSTVGHIRLWQALRRLWAEMSDGPLREAVEYRCGVVEKTLSDANYRREALVPVDLQPRLAGAAALTDEVDFTTALDMSLGRAVAEGDTLPTHEWRDEARNIDERFLRDRLDEVGITVVTG